MIRLLLMVFVMLGANCSMNAAEPPAKILDLTCWKLTLPYTKTGSKKPLEIHQPMLTEFQNPNCFFASETGDSVVFRAHCKSTSTRNSSYSRCELREMTKGTKKNSKAKWSTSDGIMHSMTIAQAITAIPPVKKHVVAGQIHDANDDVIMIRLENRKLFVERNKFGDIVLNKDYKLGTRFKITIEAYDGYIRLWHNGELKMDWEYSRDGCYFKAGCYTQSNSSKGDKPESYGEVVIYNLKVEHISPTSAAEKKPQQSPKGDSLKAAPEK